MEECARCSVVKGSLKNTFNELKQPAPADRFNERCNYLFHEKWKHLLLKGVELNVPIKQ